MRRLVLVLVLAGCDRKLPLLGGADASPDASTAGPTTRADCDLAMLKIRSFSAAANASDPDADMADCLAMPRPIVVCLGQATDMEAADRCVGEPPSGGPQVVPPEPRATAEDCRKVETHVRGMPSEGDEKAEMGMLAACREELTQSDVECLLAARTRVDAAACLSL